MDNLKNLDDYNNEKMKLGISFYSNTPAKNGIACPECGNELHDSNPMITLASLPPKKNVACDKCNYYGYRIC